MLAASGGTNARVLVGGYGHTNACSANENAQISLTACHRLADSVSKINVIAGDYITIHGCQSKKVKENQCVVDNSSSS